MSVRSIIAGLLAISCVFCSNISAANGPDKITCSGVVVDDASKPVAGAKVTLFQFKPNAGAQELGTPTVEEQITKKDGGFSFSAERPLEKENRFAMLVVQKEGYAIDWDNWQMQENKTSTLTIGKASTLSGVVVDDANKPIAGAEVRIVMLLIGENRGVPYEAKVLPRTEPLNMLVTTTDANGHFVFDGIPAKARADFTVTKAGRVRINTFRAQPGQYSAGSKDIRIIQSIEARIEGKVVEKGTSKGVGGVRLICEAQEPGGRFGVGVATSKDDGAFMFEGLAAATYTIRVLSSQKQLASYVAEPVQAAVEAGKTVSGIVVEASKGGMLEIAIRDNENKPVAGVSVSIRKRNGDRGQGGTSDANGIILLRLGAGEYESRGAIKPGFSVIGAENKLKTFTVEEGKTTRFEIRLENPREYLRDGVAD